MNHAANPLRILSQTLDTMCSVSSDVPIPYLNRLGPVGDFARTIAKLRQHLSTTEKRECIARAAPADVDAVMQIMVAYANGAFDASLQTLARQQEFSAALRQLIGTGFSNRVTWENKLEATPQELWIYKSNGEVQAFALIQGMNNRGGLERELHALAVRTDRRNIGIGTLLLKTFCRQFAGRDLFLQCKPNSLMIEMARKMSFEIIGNRGVDLLLKRPSNVEDSQNWMRVQ